jgi:hypothetical protein
VYNRPMNRQHSAFIERSLAVVLVTALVCLAVLGLPAAVTLHDSHPGGSGTIAPSGSSVFAAAAQGRHSHPAAAGRFMVAESRFGSTPSVCAARVVIAPDAVAALFMPLRI